MGVLAIVLTVLCGLVTCVWAGRHVLISRSKNDGLTLDESFPGPPSPAPRVNVLVAAKDEQDNIETCVRSLLAQDYPNFDVTVIDDRSGDRTAEIVRAIAAEDPRVHLASITDLPDGWCGKNHAMWRGIEQTDADWLVMTDADCRQDSTRTLSLAVQHAVENDLDLFSVLPNLEMKGWWENVVQPVCGGIMVIWFRPEKVNSPASSAAYANGAFMLMKRSAYHAIGTHEAVRHRVNEDMHMARLVKESGLKLKVMQNEGLYRVRMYTSLRQILNGWGRIFFGTFGTMAQLTASLAVVVVMGLMPYLVAVGGWAMWGAGAGGAWLAAGIASTAAASMQMSVMWRFYRLIRAKPLLFWTYPIGAFVAGISLVKAMRKLRRGGTVVWRNTAYKTT